MCSRSKVHKFFEYSHDGILSVFRFLPDKRSFSIIEYLFMKWENAKTRLAWSSTSSCFLGRQCINFQFSFAPPFPPFPPFLLCACENWSKAEITYLLPFLKSKHINSCENIFQNCWRRLHTKFNLPPSVTIQQHNHPIIQSIHHYYNQMELKFSRTKNDTKRQGTGGKFGIVKTYAKNWKQSKMQRGGSCWLRHNVNLLPGDLKMQVFQTASFFFHKNVFPTSLHFLNIISQ